MRILLVTERFYPATDGTTTTLKATADHLIDAGHEVAIVAPAPGLAVYRRSRVVRVSPLGKPGAQVRGAIEAFAPDLVHVTNPAATPQGLGRRALKYADHFAIPSIVVQQSPVSELTWDYWRTRIAERTDRVLVTAPWLTRRMSSLGVATQTWLPGVDTRAFSPALRDQWLHAAWSKARTGREGLVVVGFVGSLHKRHGVRHLAALADVPGIRPVIVGSGPQRDWLAARLPQAKFTGALETGDLSVATATFDLLVHPGENETCCHALREAAASGVPVVAASSGGARDLVRPLETGLLFIPGDEASFVRAVAALAADQRRSLMGEHARTGSTRDWSSACAELLDHIEQVVAGASDNLHHRENSA